MNATPASAPRLPAPRLPMSDRFEPDASQAWFHLRVHSELSVLYRFAATHRCLRRPARTTPGFGVPVSPFPPTPPQPSPHDDRQQPHKPPSISQPVKKQPLAGLPEIRVHGAGCSSRRNFLAPLPTLRCREAGTHKAHDQLYWYTHRFPRADTHWADPLDGTPSRAIGDSLVANRTLGTERVVEVLEKLAPTIGLEPMVRRLRTADDADPEVTQPTLSHPCSMEHPEPKILPASPSSSS